MADTPPATRVFTAQLRRCRSRHDSDTGFAPTDTVGAARIQFKRAQTPTVGDNSAADPPGEVTASDHPGLLNLTLTKDNYDLFALQEEVSQLKGAIEQMKREIATLHREKSPAPSLQTATCELDAVVQATEDATHNILEAAESIDTILSDMRGKAGASADQATMERLGDYIIRIFESCNFQDITGQRINKVVTAMKFIEVKIDKMIEILGGEEAIEQIEVAEEEIDEDAKLLEGPQLESAAKISQNDIDRFFD
jgi:Chemotaxis phosphatase, CheZ.